MYRRPGANDRRQDSNHKNKTIKGKNPLKARNTQCGNTADLGKAQARLAVNCDWMRSTT
jgi:hypothetical protein